MRAEIISTLYRENQVSQQKETAGFVKDTKGQELNLLNLYPEMKYQEILGFGGAITEAVGITLEQLGQEKAREIVENYFGKNGYGMIRTHIDSCDFCGGTYEADDDPGDDELEHFSMERPDRYIIPYIQLAYACAGKKLPVMLTPWTPPAYMKTNRSRVGGGKLKKEYYSRWARYICRYIEEYEKRGIYVAALSVQNEPNAAQTWDSCLFTPEEEREFLSGYLYPQLVKEGRGDIDIFIWDHNKERLFDRACAEIDAKTDGQIAGLAFHWYSGDHFDALRMVREKYPDKKLIFSEGCIEYSRFDADQLSNAQMYAHDMIGNFRAGMNGFFDWNIVLNNEGGPNHVGNYCESPVMVGKDAGQVEYKLSYYYISQFSRYIRPGARQIGTTIYTDRLEQVGFENPDGSLAVVILNRGGEERPVILRLGEEILPLTVPGRAISTVLVEADRH